MTNIVVFYSRSGKTKKVGNLISEQLKCDTEEIIDTKKRSGFFGYIKSARDALKKKLSVLQEIKKNPDSYDLIIIGTPIWTGNMSAPIRTYITENKEKFKKVAFFCTEGGSGGQKCFKNMSELCQKDPIATLEIKARDFKKENHVEKVNNFIEKIKKV
jgi:flavodoxin